MPTPLSRRHAVGVAAAGALALAAWALGLPGAFASEPRQRLPAPALDEPAGSARLETVVLAGGCFWGVQGVFQHVAGVTRAVSGYAGGRPEEATYERVSSGRTGHAEAVSITFDPARISYGEILRIFFSVALDPTEVNRQGPDTGPQYRSAIFPATDRQAAVARAYIGQLDRARAFGRPIATTLEGAARFHPAEGYHQDFLARNPGHPYIAAHDLPKVRDLQRFFPERYRPSPALVGAAAGSGASRS